ncbi:NAD(P)-dependent oxidoreductase [Flavobacterium sp.]|uniref:NAD(P)-dependent oxidoreductase n=1 Tax=Flavobacterium sp. TaxID=239 RepID=UPI0039E61EC2
MKHPKIAVIGGTGKAGKYLVQELLAQGFPVKLLLRNPDRLPIEHPLIETLVGNANKYDDVKSLLQNCGAIISTLGLGQPHSEKNIFSTATGHILKAMEQLGIKRYIVITGLNVDTPFDHKGTHTQQGTDWMKMHFPETTADKQKEYELLSSSQLDWTLVRLPLIEQTLLRNETNVSLEDCPGEKISATDLAVFLIEQLQSGTYIRKSPFIANS